MQNIDNYLYLAIAFAAGLVIGALLLWAFMPSRRKQHATQKEKQEVEQKFEQYRSDVDAHFLHTAELVNNMTAAYRQVHEELAKGAQSLCSDAAKQLHVTDQALPVLVTGAESASNAEARAPATKGDHGVDKDATPKAEAEAEADLEANATTETAAKPGQA